MSADLPAGWSIEPSGDPDHPWTLTGPASQPTGWEDRRLAQAYAWRCEAERLAAGTQPCPHPCPKGLIRALCDLVGGQRAAWRLLRLRSDRTVRSWCIGETEPSHSAAELLRLYAGGRAP